MTPDGMSARRAERKASPLFEIARVLVRFDHVASFIVNANHSITAFDSCRRTEQRRRYMKRDRHDLLRTFDASFRLRK
jgi:predicted trehalose synthase